MTSKKTSLKNIFRFVLLISIAILALCSCSQEDEEIQTSPIIRRTFQNYGPYIYTDWGETYRYNIKTQSFGSACLDPVCDGTCIPEQVITAVNQIYDGKVFLGAWEAYTHRTLYGYQDIISGEIVVLKEFDEIESSGATALYVWDDDMYYTRKILKDGGDKTNPEDYILYICRMPIDGGEEEVLYESEEENLCLVQDNLLIINRDDVFYSVNMDTWEEKVLFDIAEYGYILGDRNLIYTNGKAYLFCRRENDYFYSEYRGNKIKNYLMSFDIHTGEVMQLTDRPVASFTVNEEGIYYVPQVLRHMYVPEDYNGNPNTVVVLYADENLHFMDFDGSEDRIVYTNPNLCFYDVMGPVIDNVLYGWFSDYNEDEHYFGEVYFGGVNLQTGEIIRTVRE